MTCAGVDDRTSQQPESGEQKLLKEAEKHDSAVLSAGDSVNCVTVSADASESLEFEVSAGTAEGQTGLCSADTAATLPHSAVDSGMAADSLHSLNSSVNDSCSNEKTASGREVVCVDLNSQVDSPVSRCSDNVIVTGQNSVGSSAAELSQRSSSLSLKSIHEREHRLRKCSNQSSIQSFFKPVSRAQQHETATRVCKAQHIDDAVVHSTTNSGQLAVSRSHNRFDRNVHTSHSLKTDANKSVISETSNFTDKTRKCPFYKWIPGEVSNNSCVMY